MLRQFFQWPQTLSPITIILIISFLISVPVLIYTSESDFVVPGLLNSYQDTDTDRDSVFNRNSGCNNIDQYLKQEGYERQNATILILTKNDELDQIITSVDSIETHFNQWFHYPYVFLNNVPFDDDFKEIIQRHTDSVVEFGELKPDEWEFPEYTRNSNITNNIDNAYSILDDTIKLQGDYGVLYGDIKTYHQMCRFYSGKFYKNKLVTKYDWYWRLEPDVEFFCDITYDPFWEMTIRKKLYGFTIMIPELYKTIPNLFRVTMSYIHENNIQLGTLWNVFTTDYHIVNNDIDDMRDNMYYEVDSDTAYLDKFINEEYNAKQIVKDKLLIDRFLREGYGDKNDDFGDNLEGLVKLIKRAQERVPLVIDKFDNLEYNLCHFWSNFEIAHMSIYKNPIYDGYFDYLESHDGFWKERWGDAPVHSLGLSLLLDVEDVHYFRDIGYRHDTLYHCPRNNKHHLDTPYSSEKYIRKGQKYDDLYEYGTGCRCKCPDNKKDEVEDYHPFCINKWFDMTHRNSTKREPIFNLTKLRKDMSKEIELDILTAL